LNFPFAIIVYERNHNLKQGQGRRKGEGAALVTCYDAVKGAALG
jgi:hypothetical protein